MQISIKKQVALQLMEDHEKREDEIYEYDCECQFCECAWKLAAGKIHKIPRVITQWRHRRILLPLLIWDLQKDPKKNELKIADFMQVLDEAHRPENVYSKECKLHSPFPTLEEFA